nr:hypothetical protein [Candidatus Cloacimonadota bacterium]
TSGSNAEMSLIDFCLGLTQPAGSEAWRNFCRLLAAVAIIRNSQIKRSTQAKAAWYNFYWVLRTV